jgi:hypothetical protein
VFPAGAIELDIKNYKRAVFSGIFLPFLMKDILFIFQQFTKNKQSRAVENFFTGG